MHPKLIVLLLLALPAAMAQISCGSGFNASGACSLGSGSTQFNNGGGLMTESAGVITQMPASCGHCVATMWYNTVQNIQQFTTSFKFVPNDSAGMAFAIQNTNINNNGTGNNMTAGASGELGVIQYCCSGTPNNLFHLDFDRQYGSLWQVYPQFTCNVNPSAGFSCAGQNSLWNTLASSAFSLSPVNLANNGPYTASVTYDGYNFCMTLSDTVSNTYGPSCLKVNIPAMVGGNTAYVGFGVSTGTSNSFAGTLSSWTFTSGSPTLVTTQRRGSFAGSMH
jgi:hypothetical protein